MRILRCLRNCFRTLQQRCWTQLSSLRAERRLPSDNMNVLEGPRISLQWTVPVGQAMKNAALAMPKLREALDRQITGWIVNSPAVVCEYEKRRMGNILTRKYPSWSNEQLLHTVEECQRECIEYFNQEPPIALLASEQDFHVANTATLASSRARLLLCRMFDLNSIQETAPVLLIPREDIQPSMPPIPREFYNLITEYAMASRELFGLIDLLLEQAHGNPNQAGRLLHYINLCPDLDFFTLETCIALCTQKE